MQLEAELISSQFMGGAGSQQRVPARRAGITGQTLGERELLGAQFIAESSAQAVELLKNAVGNGRLLPEQLRRASTLFTTLIALAYNDQLELADAVLDQATDDARARGSPLDLARWSYLRSLVAYSRGAVAEAAAEARLAFDLALDRGWDIGLTANLAALLTALSDQGNWEQGEQAIRDARIEHRELDVGAVLLRASRARSRLAQGRIDDAREDLLPLEPVAAAVPRLDRVFSIRATLAPLIAAQGQRERAREMVEASLAHARAWGLLRPIATTLAAKGLVVAGDAGLYLLREACSLFARAPAPLEQARAQIELGAALRRTNRRAEARKPLRAGMDGAQCCGAIALASRARDELRATGARPRRLMLSGAERSPRASCGSRLWLPTGCATARSPRRCS